MADRRRDLPWVPLLEVPCPMCGAPVGKACHMMDDPSRPCASHSGRVRERFRLQGEADRG